MEKITEYLIKSRVSNSEVKAWQEKIMLPTYEIGEQERNPIFLEKRVYQGSSGSVYPYPVIESISDHKVDREYNAIFIENEYIKLMILPELGGRIHMAYDKVKARHFVYYNQVVKPALVGLTGPWISGGIEFNWPQHHRPTTFLPTDCYIEEFEDGSKTVWCSEVERMFRTKGAAGFTLYPGKSYIEIKAKVYNRTPYPQTFLWWANPAVVVNDDYYSVFPPDVNAVFDHGKRDVSTFPIATGTYYKYDYSAGVDISRYKNIPVPTSYMAVNSKYDFVGGYDESVKAGLLHVANHHVSTGKKQWTWGNGDFGVAWDRNLTDEDGPYIELMTGVYCDNQPDFTWIQPYEEKCWTQYFMPYSEVGMVKNATKECIVGLKSISENKYEITVYATSLYNGAKVTLSSNGAILHDEAVTISPLKHYSAVVDIADIDPSTLKLTVTTDKRELLVEYTTQKSEQREIPEPATAAKTPKEIENNEQLFLTGHHIEQYRHATYSAADYYMEALRRDSGDIRCNNAMGLMLLRKGQFSKAQTYFERAVETQTQRNPNPYDGEQYYNLGISKKLQYNYDSAYEDLYKSTWNGALQDAAFLSIAQIDIMRGNYQLALEHINKSLYRNWCNHRARTLKCAILRKLGRVEDANRTINESLELDKFNIGCRFEQYLLAIESGDTKASEQIKSEIKEITTGSFHSYIEYAIEYINASLYSEAITLLGFIDQKYPITYYAIGYSYSMGGDAQKAKEFYELAESISPDYCFPNKEEELLMLQDATKVNPAGAKAFYYLGNYWYGARQYSEAQECWEKSRQRDDSFATVHRNLALIYYNKVNDQPKATESIERAFELNSKDSRVFMELDQLYKKLKYPHTKRIELFFKNFELVKERDDLMIEFATLLNQTARYQEAYDLINSRIFHPWEGGEGKVSGQYIYCRLSLAKEAIEKGNFREALSLLKESEIYPDNLGEGKLVTTPENDIHYFMGCCYEALGEKETSRHYFELATIGDKEPQIAFFYNDQQPDKVFYQALSWSRLGREDIATEIFNGLISHGNSHIDDSVKIDYFAVSLPELLIWDDDLNIRNKLHCKFVLGLGELGLGQTDRAVEYLEEVLKIDNNHLAAKFILNLHNGNNQLITKK